MFLTPDEIEGLTKRERPSAQRKILDKLRIAYRVHPIDGTLIVTRDAASGTTEATEVPDYDVDVEGIRRHGKAH